MRNCKSYTLNTFDLSKYSPFFFLVIVLEKLDDIILIGIANIKRPEIAQPAPTSFPGKVILVQK